jgi:hypothetical protein
MFYKYSHFSGSGDWGPTVVPLLGPAAKHFEKVASAHLMPEVARYIASLRPIQTSQYVLVNAMGASEYYSSNVNGDAFPEVALLHRPDDWTGNPILDRIKAQKWPYGYPTFYSAHPFAHHQNKDPSRAFGEVELAVWNPHMRRVELVVRVDHDKCHQYGGTGAWDRLKAGEYIDVSMGTRVPFDRCSICSDWGLYAEALATFDPKKHPSPAKAVLEFHTTQKAKDGIGIRGLSITRKDYCPHALKLMNRILPDGRKVFVFNDFPRFFDISFVFIGADRTAKTMLFIFSGGKQLQLKPSVEASEISLTEDEKTAAVGEEPESKVGTISKDYVPSNLVDKAVPLLTNCEPDIPRETLDGLGAFPLEQSLSTLGGVGIVLRPREFQRVVLIRLGQGGLADQLDASGSIFPKVREEAPVGLSTASVLPGLLALLRPLLSMRSGLGPIIEPRAITLLGAPQKEKVARTSLSTELLLKIGAAYNGYRAEVMDLVPHSQNLISASGTTDSVLLKLATVPTVDMFTPLAAGYLKHAFLDEVGLEGSEMVKDLGQAPADVERGFPSKTAYRSNQQVFEGVST